MYKLGFEIRYIGPDDDPYFAIVGRDNISIMLKAVAPDVKPVPNHTRHDWAPWDATFLLCIQTRCLKNIFKWYSI